MPIDQRARKGLALMYGKRIDAHNYESYFESFLFKRRLQLKFKDPTSSMI